MLESILKNIADGHQDRNLDEIEALIRIRRQALSAQRAASLAGDIRVGTVVRLIGNMSPKYMCHAEMRVTRMDHDGIICERVAKLGCKWDRGVRITPSLVAAIVRQEGGAT